MCQQYVDDYILVYEQEIKNAIAIVLKTQHQLIEGSAGVGVAALIKNARQFNGKNVVVVLCGANISLDSLGVVLRDSVEIKSG
jgi:threonine dehydratase